MTKYSYSSFILLLHTYQTYQACLSASEEWNFSSLNLTVLPSSCCSIFTGVSQVSSRTFPLSSPRSREVRRGREGSGWDFVQRGAWPVGARSRGKVRWDLTLRFRDLIPQIPPTPPASHPPSQATVHTSPRPRSMATEFLPAQTQQPWSQPLPPSDPGVQAPAPPPSDSEIQAP